MAAIRGRDTRPELLLRKALWHLCRGRYRLRAKVVGRPDLSFPVLRVAVFVDGCFWHGCRHHYRAPGSNRRYWSQKVKVNVARDRRRTRELRRMGWLVLRLWEHSVVADPSRAARQVLKTISARHAFAGRRAAK